MLAALALFYALLSLTHYWMTPVGAPTEIQLAPSALPQIRDVFACCESRLAYLVSLVFTLVYGYVAAYNARAERFMVPLLDTLQSIPVLSFLPGVMVAMVALFPTRQFGVELGSILLIFTGQVWNMTFSFYSSLKSIPREMREVAEIYRWSWWQRFTQMELPYATIGLVWNSMMSVAGGWFFLMACEMFMLGDRDLRLPGLGSYLQTAANAGNTRAILWGMGVMIGVIVLMDQLIWRPVIAWAEKFKFEQVEATEAPQLARAGFAAQLENFAVRRAADGAARARASEPAFRAQPRGGGRRTRGAPDYSDGSRGCCSRLLLAGNRVRVRENGDAADAPDARGIAQHISGRGRDVSARGVHAVARRAVDDSRGRPDRAEAQAFGHRAADRAGGGFRAGHRAFPDHFAGADPRGRRLGNRLDRAAACWARSGTSCST